MPVNVYYPLLEPDFKALCPEEKASLTGANPKLPVVIRERDVEYQLQRVVVFHRLLLGYPYSRPRVIQEAKVDIPPLYRGKIWAAILDVRVINITLKLEYIETGLKKFMKTIDFVLFFFSFASIVSFGCGSHFVIYIVYSTLQKHRLMTILNKHLILPFLISINFSQAD